MLSFVIVVMSAEQHSSLYKSADSTAQEVTVHDCEALKRDIHDCWGLGPVDRKHNNIQSVTVYAMLTHPRTTTTALFLPSQAPCLGSLSRLRSALSRLSLGSLSALSLGSQ